jgi:hypothetical protein
MELPVYKLIINEEDETGVEFVSLVTNPAIERDFQYFNQDFVKPNAGEDEGEFISRCMQVVKGEGYSDDQALAICYKYWEGEKFESYNDYPKAASQNAQRGIKLNEAVGNDCATLVGKNRSRQLIARENLSLETIKRTYSYLSRAKEYYDPKDTKACGTISYLLWGGEEMLRWSERKLEELELRKAKRKSRYESKFAIQDEEKRIITGAAMLADKKIYRYDDVRGEYYVVFDRETIFQIAKKWAKSDRYDSVNIHHEVETKGLSLFESYIIDRERGINPPKGYEEVADGSWFLSYIVNDDAIWQRVKDGEFKGFSVEGYFDFERNKEDEIMDAIMRKMKDIVKKWDGKN